MKVESIAECSKGSILQYFWPALSDNLNRKTFLVFFLIGSLRQVLLYFSVTLPDLNQWLQEIPASDHTLLSLVQHMLKIITFII